jgi:cytochrome c peroxidase
MDQSPAELVDELRGDAQYVAEFARAFSDGLHINNVVRAIAQYERTLVSAGSRYDRFVRGEPGGDLDETERRGLERFEQRCGGCHAPGYFTDFGYHNNGVDDRFPDPDERVAWGRGRITHLPADIGKYKTPALRNVAVTAPYMHDGRFGTLEEVLEHYRSGVRPSATLDPLLSDGGLPLSSEEGAAIIAFLRTLTDEGPSVGAP